MNDALVQSARNGDQRAFAKLVEEYYRPIYGLAFSTVGNWQAAEDVAQDAFLLAWANIARLRTLDAFTAWLRRIARNLACNWIRSEHYRRALLGRREALESESAPNECAAVENLTRADTRAEIWRAMETLSPTLREAVVLFYLEENSVSQTAAVLGISENSVKKRLQRARPELRQYFERKWKAEMERERRRATPSEAGARFMAGAMLGPVSGGTRGLGSGIGLWLHGALRGEGTGRLASLLSLDSTVVRPALVALTVVAASGAALFWNANRQETTTDNVQPLSEASKLTLIAATPGAPETFPALATAKEGTPDGNKIHPAAKAASSPAAKEETTQLVTVAGRVVDEQQRPVESATITIVATGLGTTITESTSFGAAGGSAGGANTFGDVPSGVGGGFGGSYSGDGHGGGGYASGDVGGGGATGGGPGGRTIVCRVGAPASPLRDLRENALDEALLDESRRFTAETGSDGSFSIENVPGDGLLIISADALGYCMQGTTATPTVGMSTTELTFTLSPGISIQGRTLTAQGQPLADALLQVVGLMSNQDGSTWSYGRSTHAWGWTRTDVQGRFTLTVEDQGLATITLLSKPEGKATLQGIRIEPGAFVELRSPEQSVVRGTIARHDGAAAAGLIVQLTGYSESIVEDEFHRVKTRNITSGRTYEVATDVDGAYRIVGLDPNAQYTACIFDEDGTPLATDLEMAPIVGGQALLWNYTVPRPILVKGVVTEQTTGQPASNAHILCRAVSEEPGEYSSLAVPAAQTVTGADGAFEMRITTGLGNYAFGIDTPTGFCPLSQREVRDGALVVLNLVLPGTWSRNFLVLDASGKPLTGVTVLVQTDRSDTHYGYPEKTGDDGRVHVKDLVAGESVKCRFQYGSDETESDTVVGETGMELEEETIVMDMSS